MLGGVDNFCNALFYIGRTSDVKSDVTGSEQSESRKHPSASLRASESHEDINLVFVFFGLS